MEEPEVTAMGTLLIVVCILFAAWWFTRKVAGGGRLNIQSRYMRIIDRIPVSQDKFIILLQVGDKIYLAGVAASSVTLLAELDEEPEELPPRQMQNLTEVNFKELFQKMGRRNNGK